MSVQWAVVQGVALGQETPVTGLRVCILASYFILDAIACKHAYCVLIGVW